MELFLFFSGALHTLFNTINYPGDLIQFHHFSFSDRILSNLIGLIIFESVLQVYQVILKVRK